jgi:hypothetical protein
MEPQRLLVPPLMPAALKNRSQLLPGDQQNDDP